MEKQNTDDDFGRNPQYMYGGWILPMVIVSCSFWSLIMLAVYYLFLR